MAEKDVVSIDYFGDRERFADLFNVFYFAGAQMIKPEDVHEKNRSNVLPKRVHNNTQKNNDTKSIVISRDIVREIGTWQTAVILATEAQSGIHYAMPVRVMTGDSTNYHAQWQEFQKEHRKKKDLENYVTNNQEVFADLPEDAYDMILQFSNSEALDKNKENYKTNKGGINMCKALDDMIADGKIQGIITTCQEFNISRELAIQKIMKECNLSKETALEYMEQYWEKIS